MLNARKTTSEFSAGNLEIWASADFGQYLSAKKTYVVDEMNYRFFENLLSSRTKMMILLL